MTRATACIYLKESFFLIFNLSEISETGNFVARQEELNIIHKILNDNIGRRAVTLHGLNKINKTQLVITYVKIYYNDYSAILWLNIQDEISVKQSYFYIAKQIL